MFLIQAGSVSLITFITEMRQRCQGCPSSRVWIQGTEFQIWIVLSLKRNLLQIGVMAQIPLKEFGIGMKVTGFPLYLS